MILLFQSMILIGIIGLTACFKLEIDRKFELRQGEKITVEKLWNAQKAVEWKRGEKVVDHITYLSIEPEPITTHDEERDVKCVEN